MKTLALLFIILLSGCSVVDANDRRIETECERGRALHYVPPEQCRFDVEQDSVRKGESVERVSNHR